MKSVVKTNKSKALILAAGLGTRLKPFTDDAPKALYPVEGKTLLEHSINHLKKYGITEVIVNVHHFADQIIRFLEDHDNFGINITTSDETGELLDTGGGLKKVAWFFDNDLPFIVRNVDVISDLNLDKLLTTHEENKGIATLVVRERKTSRYFLFNEEDNLCGWTNITTKEKKMTRNVIGEARQFAFSGIQALDPGFMKLITERGTFSLTDLYLRISATHNIKPFIDLDSSWFDAGKTNKP